MSAHSRDLILATADRAEWSVVVRAVGQDVPLLSIGPSRVLRTASVAKLFLLVEVAAQLESGRLSPGELLDRSTVAPVFDSGLWHRMTVDALPVVDVAALVGAVSDNWATNVLLNRVGLAAVQGRAASLGYVDSALLDCVRDERTAAHPETLSVGTSNDWARFMSELAAGRIVSPGVSDQVVEWMTASCDHSMVASAFGLDPLAHWEPDLGIMVRNKTGTDAGVRADVGLVQGASQLAYAAIVNWDELAQPGLRPAIMADLRTIGEWVLAVAQENG